MSLALSSLAIAVLAAVLYALFQKSAPTFFTAGFYGCGPDFAGPGRECRAKCSFRACPVGAARRRRCIRLSAALYGHRSADRLRTDALRGSRSGIAGMVRCAGWAAFGAGGGVAAAGRDRTTDLECSWMKQHGFKKLLLPFFWSGQASASFPRRHWLWTKQLYPASPGQNSGSLTSNKAR